MSDNVAINTGSGTTIHADEYTHSTLGSGKTQLVKLADGTLDSSTPIAAGGGTKTNSLRVNIATDDTVATDLTAIKTAVEALDNVVAGSEAQVDVVTSALPTGASTAANQSTIIGHVDGIETVLGTIDTDTGNIASSTAAIDADLGATTDAAATAGSTGSVNAKLRLATSQLDSIKTSVETLDNAIAGSEMQVDVVGALPAGTNAIGKLAANSGVDIGDVDVTSAIITGGATAHDATDAGNPIKVGAKAESAVSTATMVADGDRTDLYADIDGVQLVRLSRPLGDMVHERITDTAGTSVASSAFGAVASTRNVITDITVFNSSATAGYLDLRDGTAGSVLWTIPLPAGSGATLHNPNGIFRTTANTALAYDVSAALTTVYISVGGFKSKV